MAWFHWHFPWESIIPHLEPLTFCSDTPSTRNTFKNLARCDHLWAELKSILKQNKEGVTQTPSRSFSFFQLAQAAPASLAGDFQRLYRDCLWNFNWFFRVKKLFHTSNLMTCGVAQIDLCQHCYPILRLKLVPCIKWEGEGRALCETTSGQKPGHDGEPNRTVHRNLQR